MIIAEIYGGLGNQLFEYANARALSMELNQELFFDLTFFDNYHIKDVYRLDRFNTDVKIAKKEDILKLKRKEVRPKILKSVLKKTGKSGYYSSSNHIDESWFEANNINKLRNRADFYISGYYTDQKFFNEIENVIRTEFTLKKPLNNSNNLVLSQINESISVSIHIRRGDFINNPFFSEIPLKFYLKAMDYIEKFFPNSTYFVFSDDLNWVKENLNAKTNVIYVDINKSATDYMELILMASCKHNIIANSTFSWWAAWLNNNPNKIVVAPKVWYKNNRQNKIDNGEILPLTWVKI